MNVIVVLGRRLNDDGSMHADLIKRCDKAYEYFQNHKPDKMLLSGGKPNKKAKKAESEAMREYFLQKNVPEEIILIENKSKTTYQNAKFSALILKDLGVKKVIICSSKKHLTRKYLNPCRLFKRRLKSVEIEKFF